MKRLFIGILLALVMSFGGYNAHASAVQLDFFLSAMLDVSGDPLSGDIVVTRNAANSAAKAVWEDRNQTLPSSLGKSQFNLDSEGRAEVYGDGIYTVIIYDSSDTGLTSPLYTFDDVSYGEVNSIIEDALGNTVHLAALADLTALAVPTTTLKAQVAYREQLDDLGGGLWAWDSSDNETNVDNDSLQGFYAAPDSAPTGVDGVWVRQSAFVTPEYYGAIGDGVENDTTEIQAALDSGAKVVEFVEGRTYLTGSLDVPTDIELDGNGATMEATGTPTEVFKLESDDADDVRRYVYIHDFKFSASSTYAINCVGYEVSYSKFERLEVTGGTGDVIVNFNNTGAAKGFSGNEIKDVYFLVSNWDYAVMVVRDTASTTAGVAHDNYEIHRVRGWPEKDIIYVEYGSHFDIHHIDGGLGVNTAGDEALLGNPHYLVNIAGDIPIGATSGLPTHNIEIRNIQAEALYNATTGAPNHAAVRLSSVIHSIVENIEMIRINVAKDGVSAVVCEDVAYSEFSEFWTRDNGSVDTNQTAAILSLDATSTDNYVSHRRQLKYQDVTNAGARNVFDWAITADNISQTVSVATGVVTGKTQTIYANTLGTGGGFRVRVSGTKTGTDASVWVVKFGSTNIATISSATAGHWSIVVDCWNNDDAAVQLTDTKTWLDGSLLTQTRTPATEDTTTELNVVLEVVTLPGGNTLTVDHFELEVIPSY